MLKYSCPPMIDIAISRKNVKRLVVEGVSFGKRTRTMGEQKPPKPQPAPTKGPHGPAHDISPYGFVKTATTTVKRYYYTLRGSAMDDVVMCSKQSFSSKLDTAHFRI